MITLWVYFIIAILSTIIVHELGHLIASLLCGVRVKSFSIGFGKPYLHKKLFGIDWRLSPILLGGYTEVEGEYSKKSRNSFLAQPYRKKFFIIVAGAVMNLLLACICYILNYKSITTGVMIDWTLTKGMFTKNYVLLENILINPEINLLLLQISFMNLLCAVFNLIPFPALDGGTLVLVLLEKRIKNFETFLKRICKAGMISLYILQAFLLCYIFFV